MPSRLFKYRWASLASKEGALSKKASKKSGNPIWVHQLSNVMHKNLGRISDHFEITSRYIKSKNWCRKTWKNFREFGNPIYVYQLRNVVHNVYKFPSEKDAQRISIWWWKRCTMLMNLVVKRGAQCLLIWWWSMYLSWLRCTTGMKDLRWASLF